MYCTRKINEDLTWVGANDKRLSVFEGVYSVPKGMSYNAYLLKDEKTVLFDTVDKSCAKRLLENVAHVLGGKSLDYVIVQHMEPDHSATLDLVLREYPEAVVVCNNKTLVMLKEYFDMPLEKLLIVNEGDKLNLGKHELTFINAPMVHWPEVMMTYDATDKTLFTADAFGTFGSLDGALFADEVDFFKDYIDEARRYYTNIVGKYGQMVMNVLKKAETLDIKTVCPLHGFVWRKDFDIYVEKYKLWASYEPEEKGVMIAYASVYGNTATAAEILAAKLNELGVKTETFDLSVTENSHVISSAFRFSHLVFAAPTYNAGVFVRMDELLRDLAAHNIQKRTIAFIENGSWAPISAKLMREILANNKNLEFIDNVITIRASVKEENVAKICELASELANSVNA